MFYTLLLIFIKIEYKVSLSNPKQQITKQIYLFSIHIFHKYKHINKIFFPFVDSDGSKNLMISEAFIRLFVELVGHIGNHVTTQQDGEKIFQVSKRSNNFHSISICKLC